MTGGLLVNACESRRAGYRPRRWIGGWVAEPEPPYGPKPPRLLDRVRQQVRARRMSPRTELQDVGDIGSIVRAKRPKRLPVVLTRAEARRVCERPTGPSRLVATLLYGSGLRLLECLRLRVKDLDFERRHHLHETVIQRGVHRAARNLRSGPAVIPSATPSRPTSLEADYDIRTVQELLGHKDISTTMTSTHVLNRGDRGVRSPVDAP